MVWGWKLNHSFANVIIDDPPLTLKYGFIDFKRLDRKVAARRLAMTLAFIPWNHRRGGRKAIRFFLSAADRISICIHGCNHTRAEFGGADPARLNSLAFLSSRRMDLLTKRTGVRHSKIMVFPQGLLSSKALEALKRNNYIAAVNTELRDVTEEKEVRVRDLLQTAITTYHGFPLFLRRKISEGIENLALDLLLGKPCLVVSHHDDFFADEAPLWNLVDAIDGLAQRVVWRPLEDIVTRSVGYRLAANGLQEVKVFASVSNLSLGPQRCPSARPLLIEKREHHPEQVEKVLVGGRPAKWTARGEEITVSVEKTEDDFRIEFIYARDEVPDSIGFSVMERLRIRLRRVLCEFRDNRIATSPTLKKLVRFLLKSGYALNSG